MALDRGLDRSECWEGSLTSRLSWQIDIRMASRAAGRELFMPDFVRCRSAFAHVQCEMLAVGLDRGAEKGDSSQIYYTFHAEIFERRNCLEKVLQS